MISDGTVTETALHSDVTISVVAHRQRQDLEGLLPSLMRAADCAGAEIRVVDNRSDDGTAELLAQYGDRLRVTRNPDRAGYGENHNLNLKGAESRYFVIMNTDMMVSDDLFVALRDYMDAHPDVGIVAPKVLSPDGTLQPLNHRLPSLFDLALRRFAPTLVRTRFQKRLERYEMRDVGYDAECEVPFISGAFMFARTEVLQRIGGFDQRFFLYFEDVDLTRRVARTHRTVFYPGASVVHVWKRAAHRNWRYTWHFAVSAARYFLKWGVKLA
jgi:GT2 family glycosyltransferase